jgi:diacylglycerol kinase (ATP)
VIGRESSKSIDGPVAVLANPGAGKQRHRGLLPRVLERLGAAGHDVTLLDARTGEEAERACHAAVAGGAGAVIAVGGDGTVHRALQAVAGTSVAFGVVPTGSGNDFAVEMGLGGSPLAVAETLARALSTGVTRAVDLARITSRPDSTQHTAGGRWFGAVLAAGFDAIVNERANRMRFPRGPRRYDVAILVELARLRPRPYTIDLDGQRHEVQAVMVTVGNTASYGGGMRICPDADPTDDLLDLLVVGPIGRGTLMRIKPRVYRGTHVRHPMVHSFRAREIGLSAPDITGYADGERSLRLPIVVTSVPGALTILSTNRGSRAG